VSQVSCPPKSLFAGKPAYPGWCGLTIRSSRARFAASALAGYDLTIAKAAQRPGLAQALGRMKLQRCISTSLLAIALVGCDGRYEKRFFIPVSAAPPAKVVAAVASYASTNKIPCVPRDGFLLSCWQQPVYLSVLPTPDGTEVCYSAMVAQLMSTDRHERVTETLKSQLDQFGKTYVSISVPTRTQCIAPSNE
jgi:hypothetical protein